MSAYMMTLPFRLRAARPEVCISERVERRNPSLSASRMATRETLGISNPSRNKLTPTITSITPLRKFSMICTRSSVSTSEWMYWHLMRIRSKYLLSSSAIRLVNVVTRTFSLTSIRFCISLIRWSIWFLLGTTSISGSRIPVGRMICSTTTPLHFSNS